ncbi:response regulator transcription factor [Caulobacter sp. SL161]|uniref:response regulator n=1 Tax=Caulobacter sp. SL161 TaxID=2995156 RepID=UPI0022761B67|nr:response regulator transcription factor [Caulobacter sp. SL161]MCY1647466.1 response regulator transcription factor [Caulobacter sp. SL161]
MRAWRTPPQKLTVEEQQSLRVGHLSAYGIIVYMAEDDLRPTEADILIVDDDDALRTEMASYLAGHGFVVHLARDAKEARAQLQAQAIQLVVLDVMLPGEDGLSLCRSLAGSSGPSVLMLSSMGESIDRVLGLELGADDYVVKPVTPRELLARVRALLRRRGGGGEAPASRTAIYAFSGFRFDLVRRQLRAPDETVIMLTPGELSLLGALVENPQRVLSREELARLSRGESQISLDRAIDIQISRLRKKLNEQSQTEVIKTHRGLGYILDAKVARV